MTWEHLSEVDESMRFTLTPCVIHKHIQPSQVPRQSKVWHDILCSNVCDINDYVPFSAVRFLNNKFNGIIWKTKHSQMNHKSFETWDTVCEFEKNERAVNCNAYIWHRVAVKLFPYSTSRAFNDCLAGGLRRMPVNASEHYSSGSNYPSPQAKLLLRNYRWHFGPACVQQSHSELPQKLMTDAPPAHHRHTSALNSIFKTVGTLRGTVSHGPVLIYFMELERKTLAEGATAAKRGALART